MKADYHVHTTFSDGADTPEKMILAALDMGLEELGFSDHSYTAFDDSWSMKRGTAPLYRAEIAALRERYRGRINILCGTEQDFWSGEPTDGYDYVIGSAHFLRAGGEYLQVDESEKLFMRGVDGHFGGDAIAFAEEYYRLMSLYAENRDVTIVGHFDLVTKFNAGGRLFDENDPRYTAAWRTAADALLESGKTFEINTGAIARGYRTEPYPSKYIVDYIRRRNGKMVLSSDCHDAAHLCFQFDRWEKYLL